MPAGDWPVPDLRIDTQRLITAHHAQPFQLTSQHSQISESHGDMLCPRFAGSSFGAQQQPGF